MGSAPETPPESLAPGTRLGPYEILELVGAGGMGEVYRAKDERLGRHVAVKVLPPAFASDLERLRRFELEARAAGQLNHPNVLAIYDIGVSGRTPYIVSEFVEGRSLRDLIDAGPIPPRRAAEYMVEVANGLTAAHAKGIVHRDLKPDNLHVLPDGRVKILDFGIAKLTREGGGHVDETAPTLRSLTVTGAILGTASYMAPEQVRDQPTDQRTDIFALGAILYEMLAGQKAFPGPTPADRMSAILNAEPPDLPAAATAALPGIERVLRRCLGKAPDARFDTARDLAFTLEALLDVVSSGARLDKGDSRASGQGGMASFRRLTFREGFVSGARFAPDGQTVVYSAGWDGGAEELYVTRSESPESRPVGVQGRLLSVSSAGEIAVRLRVRELGGFIELGTLARLPLFGGVPRELLEGVYMADWAPDGRDLAVIREREGGAVLDYPIGKTLFTTTGWISHPRVSPDGRRVAFFHHPNRGDNGGAAMEVDAEGRVRRLGGDYDTIWGLAWSSTGDAVWYSGNRPDQSAGIFAAAADGSERCIHSSPGSIYVCDVARSGDTLVIRGTPRMRMIFGSKDAPEVREISWFDWSLARDITSDGKRVLFDETGLGGGAGAAVYLRDTSGAPAVRLGEGVAQTLSPDGRWALALTRTVRRQLVLLPTGAGQNVVLSTGDVNPSSAKFMPDGRTICLTGMEPGRRSRLYLYDLESGKTRPISDEGVGRALDTGSPDGSRILATSPSGPWSIYPIDGGERTTLEFLGPSERPTLWTPDGKSIWTFDRGMIPCPVSRIELATGRREPWMEISPPSRGGVTHINSVCLTPDGGTYAASYVQGLHELYMASGLG